MFFDIRESGIQMAIDNDIGPLGARNTIVIINGMGAVFEQLCTFVDAALDMQAGVNDSDMVFTSARILSLAVI
jgi:hypothetical protein